MSNDYPDYEGNKSALRTIAEWAAYEGTDKKFFAIDDALIWGEAVTKTYVVPDGVDLYITQIAGTMAAALEADGDNMQICRVVIYDYTTKEVLWAQGGNGGAGMTFLIPIKIPHGHEVWFQCSNFANHRGWGGITAGGYEV